MRLCINGQWHTVSDHESHAPLATFLRSDCVRTLGVKIGCGVGSCGACTVLLTRKSGDSVPVAACIFPIAAAHGCRITTVEGICGAHAGLHPVQRCIRDTHGTQCGYCSPGFVMAMFAELSASEAMPRTTPILESSVAGNLCRCTGYRSLSQAASLADHAAHPKRTVYYSILR